MNNKCVECRNDDDCSGYDPNTHTKLVCDSPSGSYPREEGSILANLYPPVQIINNVNQIGAATKTLVYLLDVEDLVFVWKEALLNVINSTSAIHLLGLSI